MDRRAVLAARPASPASVPPRHEAVLLSRFVGHCWNYSAAAVIDRLVHHAEVVALKGNSYRLKNRDLGRVPGPTAD